MKTLRLSTLAVSFALAACNSGQPRIYRVAMDMTAVSPVEDANCYKGAVAPMNPPTSTNLRSEEQWVIWDSSDTTGAPIQLLDCGVQSFTLGNSPAISFSSDIQTSQLGTFVGDYETRSVSDNGNITEVRDTSITVKFSDEGASPTGQMTLTAQYACNSANGATCPEEQNVQDPRSCTVNLNFSARRLDTARISDDQETGTSAAPNSLSSGSTSIPNGP
jgi:hypothetical protein